MEHGDSNADLPRRLQPATGKANNNQIVRGDSTIRNLGEMSVSEMYRRSVLSSGMACEEAESTGLSLLLSDWGEDSEGADVVSVRLK